MSKIIQIQKRKKDHLKFALSPQVQIGSTGLEKYRLVHNALPEIDFDKIDTSTNFLGKKVNFPFFISCMTGGLEKGLILNKNLAMAAQKYKIAMGVGSQRAAIKHSELRESFRIRKFAPDVVLMANVGLVQLNYGFGLNEFVECVKMIEANALVLHLNPIQEVIQPEGDRNFDNLLPKLEKIVKQLPVPVIAKEVGFGLSYNVAKKLHSVGVKIFDTAGWGGTNWSLVEGLRGKADLELGKLFSDWGIPTSESIIQLTQFKKDIKDEKLVILGSGGIRNGIEIAKAITLGADLVGIAAPFATAALKSERDVELLIEKLGMELKTAMFGVGAVNVYSLQSSQYKIIED